MDNIEYKVYVFSQVIIAYLQALKRFYDSLLSSCIFSFDLKYFFFCKHFFLCHGSHPLSNFGIQIKMLAEQSL